MLVSKGEASIVIWYLNFQSWLMPFNVGGGVVPFVAEMSDNTHANAWHIRIVKQQTANCMWNAA